MNCNHPITAVGWLFYGSIFHMRFPALSLDLMTSVGFWCTVVGTIITLVSLVLAFVFYKKSIRVKKLAYFVTDPIPIASVVSTPSGYRVSLLIEREGRDTIKADEAYLFFVRLSNLGREPIRKTDMSVKDPIHLKVKEANVLDAIVIKESRPSIDFSAVEFIKDKNEWITSIIFDFLDNRDGVLIRVLTDSPNAAISMEGTVIGMPLGIQYVPGIDYRKLSQSIPMPGGLWGPPIVEMLYLVGLMLHRSRYSTWADELDLPNFSYLSAKR